MNSHSRLPDELWLRIFRLATSDPRKNELFSNSRAYVTPFSDGFRGSSVFRVAEESRLLQRRLPLLLVCKSWLPIAREVLWSHMRLRVRTRCGIVRRLIGQIEAEPKLGALVRMLSVRLETAPLWMDQDERRVFPASIYHPLTADEMDKLISRHEYEEQNRLRLFRLLALLPGLQVLVIPQTYAIGNLAPHPHPGLSTVVVYSDASRVYPLIDMFAEPCFWRNCHTLSITVKSVNAPSTGGLVTFPNLEVLKVVVKEDLLDMRRLWHDWRAPKLRTLHLSETSPGWLDFLRGVSETLEHLELKACLWIGNGILPIVRLPKLHTLGLGSWDVTTEQDATLELIRMIKAPNLQTLGCYSGPGSHGITEDSSLGLALYAFPSIRTIRVTSPDWKRRFNSWKNYCDSGYTLQLERRPGRWQTYTRDTFPAPPKTAHFY